MMLAMNRFLTKCFVIFSLCLGVSAGSYTAAMNPNAGFEIFCHNTPVVPIAQNSIVVNAADILAALGGAPAVDATATYMGGAVYYLHLRQAAAPFAGPVPSPVIPLLQLDEQAHVALERNNMGIEVSPPFHAALAAAAAAVAGGAAAAVAFAPLTASLIHGGYATFTSAFCYRARTPGPLFLGVRVPAAIATLPAAAGAVNAVCVSLKILRRESKNLKEIHWLSLPALPLPPAPPAIPTIKSVIDNLFIGGAAAAPNSATLVYYTNNSAN